MKITKPRHPEEPSKPTAQLQISDEKSISINTSFKEIFMKLKLKQAFEILKAAGVCFNARVFLVDHFPWLLHWPLHWPF